MKRVLVIDNDLQGCKRIKSAMKGKAAEVYYVISVVEALETLVRENYQLVIMDLSLSETDGRDGASGLVFCADFGAWMHQCRSSRRTSGRQTARR